MEDCVSDIVGNGLREREAMLLYNMNRNAKMKVRTPCGDTATFNIEKVVKQGTIFGPMLCCSSTSKINELGEPTGMTVAPNAEVDSLIYVDDISMAGRMTDVERVGHKLQIMEDEKKFTFNIDKGYMIVKTGKDANQEPVIKLRKGKFEKTSEIQLPGKLVARERKNRKTNRGARKEKDLVYNRSHENCKRRSTGIVGIMSIKARVPSFGLTFIWLVSSFRWSVNENMMKSDDNRLGKIV